MNSQEGRRLPAALESLGVLLMHSRLSIYVALGSLAILAVVCVLWFRGSGSPKSELGESAANKSSYRVLTLSAVAALVLAVGAAMYFIHFVVGLESAYWIVPVFGALGGLVGSLIRNVNHLPLVTFDSTRCRIRLGFVGDILLGLGGATVVAFLFDNTLSFKPNDKTTYPLMISVCFIAGVFGQLLIEMAGEKVIAKEALSVAKSAEKHTEDLKASAASALVTASFYKYDKGDYKAALDAANQALDLKPTNVAAIVAKARALKRLGRIKEALAIIDEVLKRPDLTIDSEDLGVLYYNKACYTILLDQTAIDETLNSLKRAFELKPELMSYAPKDEDLQAIWPNPQFLHLTQQPDHQIVTK